MISAEFEVRSSVCHSIRNQLKMNEMSDEPDDDSALLDFHPKAFLSEFKGNDPVSSSMFDKIFIMGNRIPKELINSISSSPEKIEQIMLASMPLFQTDITKPYWSDGSRGYTSINVDIYGAVCLADDRHLLDVIIAHGNMMKNASKYTLRQVAEVAGLTDVKWEWAPQDAIDRHLSNRGVYFHISFQDICKGMGIQPLKQNRIKILERLRRLSIMHLALTPSLNGKLLHEKTTPFSLIDKEYFPLLDAAKVRNGVYTEDTHTDLIINVSKYYFDSLSKDGIISRKRFINHYVKLVGKNSIEDCYKFIDRHKRQFVNGKTLSEIVDMYFDNKMSLFGINRLYKKNQIINQIVNDNEKLLNSFNIILKKVHTPEGSTEYVLLYAEDLKQLAAKKGDYHE